MANIVRRSVARVFGLVPRETMDGALRERRDADSRVAEVIAHEVLPELAKSLSVRGDEAHKKYVTVVQALERLGY